MAAVRQGLVELTPWSWPSISYLMQGRQIAPQGVSLHSAQFWWRNQENLRGKIGLL